MVVLFIIFLLAQIFPLIIYFAFLKKLRQIHDLRIIFFYVLIAFLSNFLVAGFKKDSSLIISIYAIFEYLFFTSFFFLSTKNKKFKILIAVISFLYLVFDVIFLRSGKTNFDFWAALFTTILIVIYSVFLLYEQVNAPLAENQYNSTSPLIIYQSYPFWIVIGCIIYLSGTLFVFLYTSDLKDKAFSSLWGINYVFEIIKNVCFAVAFILAKNKKNIESQPFDDTNLFEKPF